MSFKLTRSESLEAGQIYELEGVTLLQQQGFHEVYLSITDFSPTNTGLIFGLEVGEIIEWAQPISINVRVVADTVLLIGTEGIVQGLTGLSADVFGELILGAKFPEQAGEEDRVFRISQEGTVVLSEREANLKTEGETITNAEAEAVIVGIEATL